MRQLRFFLPYEGEPYSGKVTLFDSREDLENSKNAGFCFVVEGGLPSLILRAKIGEKALEFDYAAWNGTASVLEAAFMIAFAREIYRNHPYLLGGAL